MTASSNPQGPLSMGNVVSAGLQLYSNHFKQYFGVALRATLWALLPFVLLIVATILLLSLEINNPGLIALLVPIWFGCFLYGIGKYMATSAAIVRLAFGELTHQPESTEQATRFTNSRLWAFWGVAFLLWLLYVGLIIGVYIAIAIVVVALLAASGGFNFQSGFEQWLSTNPTVAILFVIALLLLLLAALLLFSWFAARFAIAEVPLAIEQETGATRSIGRSWQLTQKSAWRIVLILFITFLITIPLQMIVQVLTSVLQAALVGVIPDSDTGFSVLLLAATYAISLAASVIVLPLWQAIKAVIYYDLRSRKEGLGLQLRDR